VLLPSEISIPEDGDSATFRNFLYYAHTLFLNNLRALIWSISSALIRCLKLTKNANKYTLVL